MNSAMQHRLQPGAASRQRSMAPSPRLQCQWSGQIICNSCCHRHAPRMHGLHAVQHGVSPSLPATVDSPKALLAIIRNSSSRSPGRMQVSPAAMLQSTATASRFAAACASSVSPCPTSATSQASPACADLPQPHMQHINSDVSHGGLLSVHGLHDPQDFARLAAHAQAACNTGHHAACLYLDSCSSNTQSCNAGQQGPGQAAVQLLQAISAAEAAVGGVTRPGRYIADFHASATWRDAASRAAAAATAALSRLKASQELHQVLAHAEQKLAALVASDSDPAQLDECDLGRGVGRLCPEQRVLEVGEGGWGAWLRACHSLRCEVERAVRVTAVEPSPCTATAGAPVSAPIGATSATVAAAPSSTADAAAAAAGSHPDASAVARLARAVRECGAALQALLSDPRLAPRLECTHPQASALRAWLPDGMLPDAPPDTPPYQQLQQQPHTVGGDQLPATQPEVHPPQLQPHTSCEKLHGRLRGGVRLAAFQPRRLQLYAGGPWLDLRPLDSATEEVQEYPSSTEAHPASPTAPGPAPATAPATCAAGGVAQGPGGSSGSSGSSGTSSSGSSSSGGSNKSDCSSSGACSQAQARHTVVLVMTRPAVAQLLGGHPDEGVRWQVHSSCVAPQAALVMEILGHLAGLRHELARASGHDSHAAALLQGSLPAEPGALLSFLQQFAAALHAPAASDAADLARLARAAGLEVNGPGSSSSSRGSSGSTHSQSQEQRRKGLGCQQQEIAAQPQQYPQQEPPESQQAHPMQPMFDAWNVDFLLRAAMQRAHAASARTAGARVGGTERYGSLLSDWRQYAEYFTLGSLLQGVHRLCTRVMGVGLVPDPSPLSPQDLAMLPGITPDMPSPTAASNRLVEDSPAAPATTSPAPNTLPTAAPPATTTSEQKHNPPQLPSLEQTGLLLRFLVTHEGFSCDAQTSESSGIAAASPDPSALRGVVGVMYIHLTPRSAAFPFTSLLSHAQQPATGQGSILGHNAGRRGTAGTAWEAHMQQPATDQGATAPSAAAAGRADTDTGTAGGGDRWRPPVVVIHMPLPAALDGGSEAEEEAAHDERVWAQVAGPAWDALCRHQHRTSTGDSRHRPTPATCGHSSPLRGDSGPALISRSGSQHGPAAGAAVGGWSAAEQPGSEVPGAWRLRRRLAHPFFIKALLHELGHALHHVLAELPQPSQSSQPSQLPQPSQLSQPPPQFVQAGAAPLVQQPSQQPQSTPPPPPELSPALRSATRCGVDWREVPSHLFEMWGRDPTALQLLGRHWRLGVPLPPRDAARCARLLSALAATSAIELQEAAVGALGDARLSATCAAALPPADSSLPPPPMNLQRVPSALEAVAAAVKHPKQVPGSSSGSSKLFAGEGQQGDWGGRPAPPAALADCARAAWLDARVSGKAVLGPGWPCAAQPPHLPAAPPPPPPLSPPPLSPAPSSAAASQLLASSPFNPSHVAPSNGSPSPPQPDPGNTNQVNLQPEQQAPGSPHPRLVLQPLATLEDLAFAEGCAVVGGAQGLGYVLPRLIAAAAWRAHMEADALNPAAGRQLRGVLLEQGSALVSPARRVVTLLRDCACLVPYGVTGSTQGGGGGGSCGDGEGERGSVGEARWELSSASSDVDSMRCEMGHSSDGDCDSQHDVMGTGTCAESVGGGGVRGESGTGAGLAGHACRLGGLEPTAWVPDLEADAWQDVDLLG